MTVDGVKVDMTMMPGLGHQQHPGSDVTVGLWDLAPLRATGGRTFPGHDATLADRFTERFTQLRAGYILYYTPTNTTPRKDGWHEIKVSLRAGVKGRVQARPGYYAPAKK